MRKTIMMSACLAALSAQGFAQERKAGSAPKAAKAHSTESNYRIFFKMKDHEFETSGNFLVQGGSQANYVAGGETPSMVASRANDKGVEFKKHGTIVNCLPAENPHNGRVRAECQFEFSGPIPPATELRLTPVQTFQLQTSFEAVKGRALVLIDEADRRLEVRIEEAAP